ncbi:MAG: tRNA pseudouridine(13) synthase TruD [Candidatus Bathyarchaeota archaeon]|nr:MAG: tRNA pseudouridine(13) synthase TruD [Candidatus Bathyarchaeota archaeon]
MKVSAIEKQLGIRTFASETYGIGGVIKQEPRDFLVREQLVDGSEANFQFRSASPPEGEGRYLICILVKRDWDTLLAVRKITKRLGISERRLQIAGIKDKKAMTAQYISIENPKLQRLNHLKITDIEVYPLHYSTNMVFPHQLFGNKFDLTIRAINHGTTLIKKRMALIYHELRTLGGVPNFFGHQRFGTIRPITHLVGKALVQNDLERAAFLYLAKSSSYEHPKSRQARQQLLESRNFKEALNHFPRWLLYERLMLSRLAKNPRAYSSAFKRLPQRLCYLFVQAYQSYLFNCFLSKRMSCNIPMDKPQVGDYVVKTDKKGLPINTYLKATMSNLKDLHTKVEKGKMYPSIPLIGFKQAASEGMQGEIEKSILEEEEVTPSHFLIASMPKVSAAGRLRPILMPLMDFIFENPSKDDLNPSKKKITLCYSLHRGCYATIVLREFMKPRSPIEAGF